MEAHAVERKLAAIFAADVEGYSRLMGRDEVGTLRTFTAYRVIIDRPIASHRGRIFNTAGDSLVADFASAVDVVQCAVEVQDAIGRENTDRPVGEQIRFRIGIHVGDTMAYRPGNVSLTENPKARATSHAIQRRSDRLAHPRFRLLGGHYRSGDRPDTATSYASDERRHRGKKQEHE